MHLAKRLRLRETDAKSRSGEVDDLDVAVRCC